MPIYYLDTSAIMKRYRTETGSNVLEELFGGLTGSDELATSYLTLLEVNSAVSRLLRGRMITQRDYQRILSQFRRDIAYYEINLIPVQNELIDRASDTVRGYPLRSLDALHLASAIENRLLSSRHALYVVSADRELIAASESHGIATLDPQLDDALDRLRSPR